jgi:hypothetical protein
VNTYVLPKINEDRRRQLENCGVPFSEWTEDSVLIDGEQNLELALQVLDLNARIRRSDELIELKVRSGYAPFTEAPAQAPPPPPTPETPPPQPTQEMLAGRGQSRALYVNACRERLKETLKTAHERARQTKEQLEEAARRFFSLARKSSLSAPGKTQESYRQELTEEAAKIHAVPRVLDVVVGNNGIGVCTDVLYATAPDTGVRHEIGSFMIWIRPSGENPGVFWVNRTRRIESLRPDMNAPYVFADGTAAIDDARAAFQELIARGEFANACDLAIQYIETAQPDSPLTAYLSKWPVAE